MVHVYVLLQSEKRILRFDRHYCVSNFTTVGVKTGAPLKPQKQEEKLSHSFKNAGPVLYLHFIKYYEEIS